MAYKSDGSPHTEDSEVEALILKIRKASDGKPEELIPMLQQVQQEIGYLPETTLLEIANITRLSAAFVFGVATFYTQFRFHPMGRHTIRVCRGTACHVKGAERILSDIETQYKITPGETTEDGMFSLETVACFGSCALAPVVLVDDSVKGRMNPSNTRKILKHIEEKPEPASSGTRK